MGEGCGCLVMLGIGGLALWVLSRFSVHALLVIIVVLLLLGLAGRE